MTKLEDLIIKTDSREQRAESRRKLAASMGVSVAQLNNYISAGLKVERLADDRYVLVTSKTKIFEVEL